MNVVVLEPYSLNSLARLKAAHLFALSESANDLAQAEILLIRSRTRIDAKFLDKASRLKLIVTATSGFDHIDLIETKRRGIVTTHTPDANAQSTAELTIGLILALERQIPQAHKNVRGNNWREGLKRPKGLEGKTLGIVGLGRVGSRVARVASALGMRIEAYDPYVTDTTFQKSAATRIGFIELLRTADIVTLHVPLTNETTHMLAQPTFLEMQNDAFLINTCRGPVVDENDLLMALDDRVIAGAAMDVIEREPPPAGHRVLTHPLLLLTPHIGAFTQSAWEKASQEAIDKVIAFQQGQALSDTLPLES